MSLDRTDPEPAAAIRAAIISLSDDSYVRLSYQMLLETPLVHLISGMDEEGADAGWCGCGVPPIGGYTEWTSRTTPVLSVGWDWQLGAARGEVRCVRLNAPRSNVMLIDAQGRDLGAARTATLLASVVDGRAWQPEVLASITTRYA